MRVAAVLAALALFAGCRACEERRGPDGECLPPKESEARVAISALPSTLDWNRSHESSAVNYPVLQAAMRGLTELGPDHVPVPDLAESWTRAPRCGESADGHPPDPAACPEVWTFRLREGVVWSDGKTPLVAKDFVVGWRRALLGREPAEMKDIVGADEVLSLRARGAADFELAAALDRFAVQALDERTLEVTLTSPRSYFASRIATVYTFYPSPSADLAKLEGEREIRRYFDEPADGKPMSLGPYRIDAYDRVGQLVRLIRNPHDRVKAPPGAVQKLLLVQADLAPLLWKRCQLDFFFLDDAATLPKALAEGDVEKQPLLSTYWLGLNTGKLPAGLREAIARGVDRQALFSGMPSARTGRFLLPPELPGGSGEGDPLARELPSFDLDAARALVKANAPGRPLTLLVRGSATFLPELAIADGLRRQLEALGLTVNVVTTSDFSADIKDAQGGIRHDLFLKRTGADFSHPQTFFTVFGPSGNHYTRWHELDGGEPARRFAAKLKAGAAVEDPAEMQRVYGEAQKILLAETHALVPLYYPDRYFKRRAWLEGVGVTPFNFLTLKTAERKP